MQRPARASGGALAIEALRGRERVGGEREDRAQSDRAVAVDRVDPLEERRRQGDGGGSTLGEVVSEPGGRGRRKPRGLGMRIGRAQLGVRVSLRDRYEGSVEMNTLFSSVLCTSPSIPSSFPTPDCLYPPNGACGKTELLEFTPMPPVRSARATRS